MKYFFLINPAAGKGRACRALEADIRAICGTAEVDFEIHYTTRIGDARDFTAQACAVTGGECRFFACGGDGTVSETINGAAGFEHAAVGVIPIGTGNDFVRNFTRPELFFDIAAQINGSILQLDLIKYNGHLAANTLNVGFDAEVVNTVRRIKRNPLVPSKPAYMIGALTELLKKPGVKMKVSIDGSEMADKDLLLCCAGNGAYCGGGFNSGPLADISDGMLDVCFIKNVGRLKFITLIGAYKKGTYLNKKGIEQVAEYIRCQQLDIELSRAHDVSIDGELCSFERMSISAAAGALRFSLPAGCEQRKPAAQYTAKQTAPIR